MTSVTTKSTDFKGSPYGITGEEVVIGLDTSELNHTELHYHVVNQFLRLGLGKSTFLQVTLDIDIEEG